jgi:hypothetical protein
VREDDVTLLGCIFQHPWIICTGNSGILHTGETGIRDAPPNTAQDIVVKILVRAEFQSVLTRLA